MHLRIPSVEAMEELAGRLAEKIPGGTCVLLQGELGAGKTTFVRGFLHHLGHAGTVKSPTYTLIEPYQIKGRRYYHFDLYRVNSLEELEGIGFRDYFEEGAVCLVEWPERAEGAMSEGDLRIVIAIEDSERSVELKAESPRGERLLAQIAGE